jgi:hypothetical protein
MQLRSSKKQCTHHWIIDSSKGTVSYGRCSLCGMTKEFINEWETAISKTGKDTLIIKDEERS